MNSLDTRLDIKFNLKSCLIRFVFKDNEMVAEINFLHHLMNLLLQPSFYFSVFIDRSFNLALSCSRWLLSHRRLLITTQIPVNYQTSSSVFAT